MHVGGGACDFVLHQRLRRVVRVRRFDGWVTFPGCDNRPCECDVSIVVHLYYTAGASVAGFCVCAFLALLAICLIQLLLSIMIRPMLSYVFTVVYLFASAFYDRDWLLGGFIMSIRVDGLAHDGLSPVVGSVLSGIVVVCVALVGMIVVSRIDIVEKEGVG